jgi:hypothetical protein
MNERDQRTLVRHGAIVFLLGLAAGFPFAVEIVGRLDLWPFPASPAIDMPGDYRGWRMAHLEGVLNGLLLISVAAVGGHLKLGKRGAAWVTRGLLVCAWGNILASWIGPLAGQRGLTFDGLGWNSLVYLLFVAAIVGVIGAMVGVWAGARERPGQGEPG